MSAPGGISAFGGVISEPNIPYNGNFGSDDRVDYTIIGNEVNLASRLQSHADLGGILLAHETYSLVKDVVLAEETGTITVKGFSTPVRTHRVVGLHDGGGIQGRVIRSGAGWIAFNYRSKKVDAGRTDGCHPGSAGSSGSIRES